MLAGVVQGHDLGMRLAGCPMPPAANNPLAVGNHAADAGIGMTAPQALFGQSKGEGHALVIEG